jgi:4-amino-4-deoxy-L-arabinose transferase-like glycosyltransferase
LSTPSRILNLRSPTALLAIIILAGLLVRLPMIGYSFYGDEGFTVLRDAHRLITDSEDRFRPVFFSLVYLWKQLGFHGEVGLRLLPLLFGLAQIPLAYLIGKKLDSKSLGLTFATLVAASPMLIEFSQELRMYSLVALIALAQVWILLQLFEEETRGRWIAFVVIGVIGVYTHLHYWLFLAGIALTFVRENRTLKLWKGFAALSTMALLYALNFPNILLFMKRRGGEYATHFPSALPKLLAAFTVGFNYFKLPEQGLGRAVEASDLSQNLPLVILVAIPAAIILWRVLWLHVRVGNTHSVLLPHELFTVPVLLAFVASMVTGKYWLQPKYLIFSAPFALLFIALAFLSINHRLLRRLTGLLGFAVFAFALAHFWNPQDYGRRENWRGAANVLRESLDSNSALVLLPGNYGLLTYYAPELDGRWQTVTPPKTAEHAAEFEAYLRARLADAREIYYLRYDVAQNVEDPHDLLPLALDNLGTPSGVIRFNPRFRLYRWIVRAG